MNPTQRRLYTGLFQPDLEAALGRVIGDAQAGDPGAPVLVLVGSFVLTRYLPRRLARTRPLWNVRFVDFRGLLRMLRDERPDRFQRERISDIEQRLLLRQVVEANRSGYFRPVADLPGFVRRAAETIRDLKDACVPPGALAGVPGTKQETFRRIAEDYDRQLEERGLCDASDQLAKACSVAVESARLAKAHFVAYGFYDLTGLQRRLVLAAADRARSAAALVPATDGPAFTFARPLADWFHEHGFVDDAITIERTVAADPPPSFLATLFESPGEPALDDRFRVLSTPGEPREVREIVREVLRFARAGVPFAEIGVLLRNHEAYAESVVDAFQRAGIPYFLSGGRSLLRTRPARTLALLSDLLAGELPRADVMQFVRFAPLDLEALLGREADIRAWERLTIDAWIVEGPEQWEERLARLQRRTRRTDGDDDRASGERDAEHLATLRAFVRRLIAARDAFRSAESWAGAVDALLAAYRDFVQPSDLATRAAQAAGALRDLDRFMPPRDAREFCDTLRDQLAAKKLLSTGFQRGSVTVADLLQARGLRFRAVVVPGLVEKSFPAVARQDPILLDGERVALAKAAGPEAALAPKAARADEERLLFALVLAAGSEYVTLTFPRLDVASGRERIPSHFLVRLAEALSGRRFSFETLDAAPGFTRVSMFPDPSGATMLVDADDYDLHRVAAHIAGPEPARALYLAELAAPFRRGIAAELARWRSETHTAWDGFVPEAGRNLVAEPVSPTRLEEFARCPFAYFLHRVLHVDPLDDPELAVRLSPLDRGSLIHRVLHHVYAERFAGGVTPGVQQLAAALADAARREFLRLDIQPPALTWALEQAEIISDLALFARMDLAECDATGAQPAEFELEFCTEPDADPAVHVGDQPVRFHGRIDRVDHLGSDVARVIDYKTGRRSAKAERFDGGHSLQLPVYLLGAGGCVGERDVEQAAYAYPTRRGEFGRVPFSAGTLRERWDEFVQIVVTIIESIGAGRFAPMPGDVCRSCDFSDACGSNRVLLAERKAEDPGLADLLAIGEIK
jgi:RecB family exonuclease